MKNIKNQWKAYTTSVDKHTIDEAPMVYKPIHEIMNIQDAVESIKILKQFTISKQVNKMSLLKNIVLDIVMGLICILCIPTLVGLLVLPIVLDSWERM